MATIRVFKDLLKAEPEIHHTEGETRLIEWLANSEYSYIGQQGAIVCLNNVVIADSSKHDDMAARTDIKVGLFDTVDVISHPHGVDPITALIYVGIAVAAAGVAIALTPEPELPNDAGKRQDSPNNQLNAATNSFRPRQAIPDIAGEVVSYPDFVQSSYYTYSGNIKRFTEVFCFGVGYYNVEDVKDGETLFDDSPSSSFTVYSPDGTLPMLADVRASNNVDGQEILPPDNTEATASMNGATVVAPNRISTFDTQSIRLSDGDNIDIDISWNGGSDSLAGTYTVSNVSGFAFDVNGVTLNNSLNIGDVMGTITNSSSTQLGQWFVLQGDDIEEIRFHIIAPQGLRDENGDFLNVQLSIEAEQLDANGDPTGTTFTSGAAIGGDTLDPQYRTFTLDSDNGITPDRYRARVVRTTNEEPAPGQDLIKFERLESVRYYTPAFGNVTTLITNRRATTQPTSGRQSKTNALVTRELPIFDPNTGTFGGRAATRSFAQYVMYLLNTLGGVPLSNIAYEELFDIEDSLPDARLGYFDFTFDSQDQSLRQRVESACNAARVKVYNVGNNWRFVREEAKPVRSAVFNRRNLAPESSTQTWQTFRNDDYDSVELKYVDPDTNSEAYVRRRIDGNGDIQTGLGDRVKEMTLAGCRNEFQATNRCELEVRRIRYQRYSITDTALSDALRVGVGNRVGWGDINDTEVFHGEILAQEGNVFTASEPFEPSAGETYYVHITDEDGTVSNSVVAAARSDGNKFGFEASGLVAYTADGYTKQLGSMYIISRNTDVTDFVLTKRGRPNERGECQIEASVYDERMFAAD